jgi:hypothetical protein
MATAWVLTKWSGDGQTPQTAWRPQIAVDFALDGWSDPVGQVLVGRASLPLLAAVLIRCSDAVLAAIYADPRYGSGPVLWDSTRPLSELITQAEFDALATWIRAQGFTLAQARAALGTQLSGRTRAQIAAAVRTALRSL